MLEQSKAARRRFYNGNFHNRYLSGHGIDIGGKPDPFSQYIGVFPLVKSVKIWDLEDGDAQEMATCKDDSFDFVVSSHCLEHMVDVYEALKNWIRITKSGGYIIITVPDEDMYEQAQWPSCYNGDHKHTFSIQKSSSWSKHSINVFELLQHFQDEIEVEKVEKIAEFFDYNIEVTDQTLQPNVESAIEFIVRKKSVSNVIEIQKNRIHLKATFPTSFQVKFSHFFNKIEALDKSKKYVIYGNGSVAKILNKFLNESIVTIVDKDTPNLEQCLNDLDYDFLIISVLGREEQISEYLKKYIDINKMIKLL
jgi:predicted SAM-dependent methyltransferase